MAAVTRPQPKRQIAVRKSHYPWLLRITASTQGARDFVETEAGEFGELVGIVGAPDYELRLNGTYDRDEVAAYLESYGAEGLKE